MRKIRLSSTHDPHRRGPQVGRAPSRGGHDSVLKSVHTNLIAVDSETDHLPVRPVREVWAPAAVAEKNREVAEAEARHRVSVAEACRQILHHLDLIDCIGLERYRDESDK